MPNIHLFNPGHETAVLFGSESYTPPRNVRKMQEDLALLPLWYAESGDYVWTGLTDCAAFLSSLPTPIVPSAIPVPSTNIPTEVLTAMPWGMSPQSLRFFRDINRNYGTHILVPEWKETYRQLTGRQTAVLCLEKIRERLPGWTIPDSPCFCSTEEEVDLYLFAHSGPCLLKTPFSSSGRGLLWIADNKLSVKDREWIRGALQKQDVVSVEQGLDKIQDFAMEFHLDAGGQVSYEGLSVFGTAEKGAYTGNRLGRQDDMLEQLVKPVGKAVYEQIRAAIMIVLRNVFGGIYTGYLGVDMLLYRDVTGSPAIHPCIEINMRYTMGMVAVRLFRQYIYPEATGSFFITYDKDAYREHQRMQKQYPLLISEGRIRSGYQALCPVTAETHYRAFILID